MSEEERNLKLDAIGRVVAEMFPGKCGSVKFSFNKAGYAGKELNLLSRPEKTKKI